MSELVGGQISFEGDLSACEFPESLVVGRKESPLLRRLTQRPRQDFVRIRLTATSLALLFAQVQHQLLTNIIHVQIERAGVLELSSTDYFEAWQAFVGPGVPQSLLEEMKEARIIADFKVAGRKQR
jgi:hypothetical protein